MEWDFWTLYTYFLFIGLPLIGLVSGVILAIAALFSKEPVDFSGVEYENRDDCIVPSRADKLNCPLMYHAAYDDNKH